MIRNSSKWGGVKYDFWTLTLFPVIPAKNGKLGFVAAEDSIFLWAKAMGYRGAKREKPHRTDGKLEFFSYLDGAVVHCKVVGEGHGAAGAIDEATRFPFPGRKRSKSTVKKHWKSFRELLPGFKILDLNPPAVPWYLVDYQSVGSRCDFGCDPH